MAKRFIEGVKDKARLRHKTIVLPEGNDWRILEAASIAAAEGIARIIILGDPEAVGRLAAERSIDLSHCQIIDHHHDARLADYAAELYDLRRHRGMKHQQALETIRDPLYFSCMMVRLGDADAMVGGSIYSTSDLMRAALQVIKAAPGVTTVSSVSPICMPDRTFGHDGLLIFGDTAINENPSAEQLADIAIASAETFQRLTGAEPYVAMLSYSTLGSAKSERTDKVVKATEIARARAPKLKLDGEMQVDAAIVEAVARSKAPDSTVAGKANVLIFPDLNSGNIAYKLAQRLAGADVSGAIIQGLGRPVNELSRGCSVTDIVGQIALAALQA